MVSALRRVVRQVEDRFDGLKLRAKDRLNLVGDLAIMPYRGFGTPERVWTKGRVIEAKKITAATQGAGILDNAWRTINRYDSDEIPGAEVRVDLDGVAKTVTTDEEGFFETELAVNLPVQEHAAWHDVHADLVSAPCGGIANVSAPAHILVPGTGARFGVISDIDDTIVKTGATNFLKNWRTVIVNNAASRVAFRGVAELYQALQGEDRNPVFYISSSPWNLFDLFERYMVVQGLPLGPMLLKDLGLDDGKWLTGGHSGHKLAQVERLLSTYPDMRFILVGDSGQRDAFIYRDAVKKHPGRFLAVFIRDVTDADRDSELASILREIEAAGPRTAYGPDLVHAAGVCAEEGWIAESALAAIRAEVEAEERAGA